LLAILKKRPINNEITKHSPNFNLFFCKGICDWLSKFILYCENNYRKKVKKNIEAEIHKYSGELLDI
jgi:hypothetical protein